MGDMGAQLFLAPGASTKKAATAVGKALASGALRHSGWTWGDVAAYEAEVNLLPRFLVDTGLSSGALMSRYWHLYSTGCEMYIGNWSCAIGSSRIAAPPLQQAEMPEHVMTACA